MAPELLELQTIVDQLLARKGRVRVLEAGCGSVSNVKLGPEAHIVGIDISQRQLAKNTAVQEKILGDIETYPLPRSHYDVIVCWDVLEHLRAPEKALDNFVAALKRDGLLVLAFSNVRSLKGLVTRLTPYRFHRAVYRFVYRGRVDTPGYEPFPTILSPSIAPDAMKRFASQNHLAIELFRLYESGMQKKLRQRCGLSGWRWGIVSRAVKLLSVGLVDPQASDCILVMRMTEKWEHARAGVNRVWGPHALQS